MIRLALPMFITAVVAWLLLFGVHGKVKKETHAAIRQGCIAFSIATAVVIGLGLAFLFKGAING